MPTIHAIPAFADNYIWIIVNGPLQETTSRATAAIVVDPGDAVPVLSFLQRWQLRLAAIFVTHHHHDHVDGIAELLRAQPAAVYGPPDESIPCLTHPLRDNDHITPAHGMGEWAIMRVPGHTRGHIAFWEGNHLFCGDTLFGGGCGRVFDGSVEQLHASLNKIAKLPTTTRVYCAHEYTVGNLVFGQCVEPSNTALAERLSAAREKRANGIPTVPSALGEELATNVFLRCHVPAVQDAVRAHAGRDLADTAAVFTALRRWKDQFKVVR